MSITVEDLEKLEGYLSAFQLDESAMKPSAFDCDVDIGGCVGVF